MSVYVDNSKQRMGKLIMCNMWADTTEELIEMVDRIGVQRRWIHGHPESVPSYRNDKWIHIRLGTAMRRKALEFGAIATDIFGPIEFVARTLLTTEDDKLITKGLVMLETLRLCRELRSNQRTEVDAICD